MISVIPHRNKICSDGPRNPNTLSDCGIVGLRGEVERTFPKASRAPSKKSSTPSMMNIPPNEVKATPISVTGLSIAHPVSKTKGFGLTLSVREPHFVLLCQGGGGGGGGQGG